MTTGGGCIFKSGYAMSAPRITEQQVVEALRRIPAERWREILDWLNALHGTVQPPASVDVPIRTLGDVLGSGLVGLWADLEDITDSREFARPLRHRASRRRPRGKGDAAGQ
jgi:hypothetical protein